MDGKGVALHKRDTEARPPAAQTHSVLITAASSQWWPRGLPTAVMGAAVAAWCVTATHRSLLGRSGRTQRIYLQSKRTKGVISHRGNSLSTLSVSHTHAHAGSFTCQRCMSMPRQRPHCCSR